MSIPESSGPPGRLRIVSGGQTGVDRAALDVARENHIACAGWCPKGRRAEDGAVPPRYLLRETPSSGYSQRTEWNVRDSDATLVLHRGPMQGGTALTARMARRLRRPVLHVDLAAEPDPSRVHDWLRTQAVRVLNVAGPRESQRPGIYEQAKAFLRRALGAGTSRRSARKLRGSPLGR